MASKVLVVRKEGDAVSDVCEDLVFCLECASTNASAPQNMDTFSAQIEKATLYRAYLDVKDLSLLEQLLYAQQKFSEYNDTWVTSLCLLCIDCKFLRAIIPADCS
jgi:hypothetical protein